MFQYFSKSAAHPVEIGPPSIDKSKPYQLDPSEVQKPEAKASAPLISLRFVIAKPPLQVMSAAFIVKIQSDGRHFQSQ